MDDTAPIFSSIFKPIVSCRVGAYPRCRVEVESRPATFLLLKMRLCAPAARRAAPASSRSVTTHAMNLSRRSALVGAGVVSATGASLRADANAGSVYDFTVQQFDEDVSMSKYRGDVLVVVNVASE